MSVSNYSNALTEMGPRIGIAIIIVVILGIVAVILYLARTAVVNFVTALLIRRRAEGGSDGSTEGADGNGGGDGRKRPAV